MRFQKSDYKSQLIISVDYNYSPSIYQLSAFLLKCYQVENFIKYFKGLSLRFPELHSIFKAINMQIKPLTRLTSVSRTESKKY